MAKKEVVAEVEEKTAKPKPTKEEMQARAAKMREARDAAQAKDKFVYVKEPEKKFAPQAMGILEILKKAGKKGLSRVELVKAMDGVITSRQPLGRILSYYQKALAESGCVELIADAAAE